MAITTCKECHDKVSDTALTCPHCGAPTPGISNQTMADHQKRAGYLKHRWIAGLAFWPGIMMLLWPILMKQGGQQFMEAWGTSKWLIGFGVMWYVVKEIQRNFFERKVAKK